MLFNVVWYQPTFTLNLVKIGLVFGLTFCFLKISLVDFNGNLKKSNMNQITLHNLYVELKRDKNGKTYFSIHDKNTGKAYLIFPNRVKGWYDLAAKWAKAKEIRLYFSSRQKIIRLQILKTYPRYPNYLLP